MFCRFIQDVTSRTSLNHHIIRKSVAGVVRALLIRLNARVHNAGSNHSVVLVRISMFLFVFVSIFAGHFD